MKANQFFVSQGKVLPQNYFFCKLEAEPLDIELRYWSHQTFWNLHPKTYLVLLFKYPAG